MKNNMCFLVVSPPLFSFPYFLLFDVLYLITPLYSFPLLFPFLLFPISFSFSFIFLFFHSLSISPSLLFLSLLFPFLYRSLSSFFPLFFPFFFPSLIYSSILLLFSSLISSSTCPPLTCHPRPLVFFSLSSHATSGKQCVPHCVGRGKNSK